MQTITYLYLKKNNVDITIYFSTFTSNKGLEV